MAGKKDAVKDADRFSILVPRLDRCYLCGTSNRICLHEVYHGSAFRKKSKLDGLILPICFECHQGTRGVHNNPELDLRLKKETQRKWMDNYCDEDETEDEKISDFIRRYGRNYL